MSADPVMAPRRPKPCQCHAGPFYASLVLCPACGHKSFDPKCGSCERAKCGYEERR